MKKVLGYIGDVFVGSVVKGFTLVHNLPKFATKIETQKPLPTGCLY